jgi:hypothetical protein
MGIYLEAGEVTPTRVPAAEQAAAKAAGKAAIKAAADQVSGFQSAPDPKSRAGIRISLVFTAYAHDASGYTCVVIAQFFALPRGESFTTKLPARGNGAGATLGECLVAAVKDLIANTQTELFASQAKAGATPAAAGAKAKIYIGPFKVKYGSQPPQKLQQNAVTRVTTRANSLVPKHKSGRFFMGTPPTNPADPGYIITINIVSAVAVASPIGVDAKCEGLAETYIANSLVVPTLMGAAKLTGGSKDSDFLIAIEEAAEKLVDTALTGLDGMNP